MSKPRGDSNRTTLTELLADPLVRMVMRADRVTERQLVSSIGATLSKLGTGSSRALNGESDDRTLQDYRPSVGVILLNRHNQVFVGRRRHNQVETWQVPQGTIRAGERARVAALRELKTQIGTDNVNVLAESKNWLFYELPVGLTGRVRRKGGRGQRQKWLAMRFKGADADINIANGQSEFNDWKWVGLETLPKLLVSLKRLVYLSVLDEFLDAIGPYDNELGEEEE